MNFNELFEDLKGVRVVDPALETRRGKILVYGPAGSGKTVFAASASHVEDLSPVLYIDNEAGTAPLKQHANMDNVVVLNPSDFLGMVELRQRLKKLADSEEGFPFKTVVFDTIDNFQEQVVKHWKNSGRTGFEMWAAAYDILDDLFQELVDLGCLVILLTHESKETYGAESDLLIAPNFEGKKTLTKLPSKVDAVWRLSKMEHPDDEDAILRVLTTDSVDGILTKSRYPLPAMLGEPSMSKVWEYMVEEESEDEE